MRNKIRLILIVWIFSLSSSVAQKIDLDSLDIFIHQLMHDFDVPGLAIGIVQDDAVLFSKGFGTREINKKLPVDENTLFGIGSISKSMTALTLGILVDEGKINWDDKVKTYLPYFELYDPYVTENFTIRDLLTHRSGLRSVSGGALYYHSDYSREEIIKRIKYLEPIAGFREKPAYQNLTYLVASEIVKVVSGMSWDDFVKERVFAKLNMSNTTTLSTVREASNNLAQPHTLNENYQKVAITQEKGDNLAPAGSVYSSAKEMTNYMRLLLNKGAFGKDTLVSQQIIQEIFKPQIHYAISGDQFANEFTSYGFGWWLTPKKGHKVIEHSGGIDGMIANLIMIEDMNVGFVILSNTRFEPAVFLLSAKLLEDLIDDKSYEAPYAIKKEQRDGRIDQGKKALNEIEKTKIKNTKPSLAFKDYAGTYFDKMYGDIIVYQTKIGELEISFTHTELFKAKLKHWHFDTFKIEWYDTRVPHGFLTFNFNSKREIIGFSMDQENLLDVDFGELEIKKSKN